MWVGVVVIGAMLAATVTGGLVRAKEEWKGARDVLGRADRERDLIIACPFWKVPALMAATRGIDGAPMATPNMGRLQLIERHMGVEPRWERLFYQRAYAAILAPALKVAPPEEATTVVPARDLFVMTSECGPEESRAIREWASDYRVERSWTSAKTADHAGIVIEQWRLVQPRQVTLSVVR